MGIAVVASASTVVAVAIVVVVVAVVSTVAVVAATAVFAAAFVVSTFADVVVAVALGVPAILFPVVPYLLAPVVDMPILPSTRPTARYRLLPMVFAFACAPVLDSSCTTCRDRAMVPKIQRDMPLRMKKTRVL